MGRTQRARREEGRGAKREGEREREGAREREAEGQGERDTDRQRERERESLLPMRDTESTAECGTPRRVAAVDVDARPLLCPCPKTAL